MTNAPIDSPDASARLTGVGVGPGDPALITLAALRELEAADRVIAPTSDNEGPGRAESIVRAALPDLGIERLLFDMSAGPDGAADREASHLAAARRLLPLLGSGLRVAFVTLGDPNIYSTFPSLVDALRQLGWEGRVFTIPGVTAFQALAAATDTVLLDGTESLALVTALAGTDEIERALADPTRAVVVYKGGRRLVEVAHLVASRRGLDGAVFGERLGLADERVGPLKDFGEEVASYLATVIVPPVARARATTFDD